MNYIFDVDGTLIDSYEGIIESIIEVLESVNINMNYADIKEYILKYSVHDLFIKVSNDNISYDLLNNKFKSSRIKTQYNYSFMPNALELINKLYDAGSKLFIFTHKSNVIEEILKDNNVDDKFIEVISQDSKEFVRKPSNSSLLYLINKYDLNKEETYYVGDRSIDIMCANNAGIKSIFYNVNDNIDESLNPTRIVNNLIEIVK